MAESRALIYKQGPRKGLDDVEFALMTYVDWFNHRRLHGEINNDASYTSPAEAEADYYRQNEPTEEAVTQRPNPARFTADAACTPHSAGRSGKTKLDETGRVSSRMPLMEHRTRPPKRRWPR